MDGPLTDASPDTDETMMGDMLLGSGKRVFAQDDVRLVAQRAEGEEASLAAAESRRDALRLATQRSASLSPQVTTPQGGGLMPANAVAMEALYGQSAKW